MDFDNQQSALQLAEQLDPSQCRLKVGKELFTVAGPQLVKALVERNFVFFDLLTSSTPPPKRSVLRPISVCGRLSACGGS